MKRQRYPVANTVAGRVVSFLSTQGFRATRAAIIPMVRIRLRLMDRNVLSFSGHRDVHLRLFVGSAVLPMGNSAGTTEDAGYTHTLLVIASR